ncbi:MAG: SpoVA/SpoVAEb family sporulation membrane protein [Clostridiales bacterium]|jgi:stage V sporulation protein AC|nr:SpoVA/SpoVAEb family sporulation membrane protein [Clostridiales bacterium]
MDKTEYLKFVEENSPKTRKVKTMLFAFIAGGSICCIGEAVRDVLDKILSPTAPQLSSYVTIIMIFLGSFFTAVGLYDKLGRKAGAGSVLPITGFANSVTSAAIEHNREGVVFGICAQMFTVAGPVIVFGIVLSVVSGIVKLLFLS